MDGIAVLAAHDLYRFYHTGDSETRALRGVSLEIRRGEIVAVMGPSGSGKSSLIACLAGIDDPDGGYVEIDGVRMTRRPETERARLRLRQIGVLMQSGNMLNQLTVSQNLEFAMRMASTKPTGIAGALDAVGVAHRAGAYPAELSGGELARASLALALINDPAILLADEPTGEVDAENEAMILRLFRQQADHGRAIVVVTHSPAVASSVDRILRMTDGRLADA